MWTVTCESGEKTANPQPQTNKVAISLQVLPRVNDIAGFVWARKNVLTEIKKPIFHPGEVLPSDGAFVMDGP